jgi:hypothetical protein
VNEIWKDINGYEKLYQISNLGRVKSCSKEICHFRGGKRILKEKLRKLVIDKDGYCIVDLYKNGIGKMMKVHRLVGIAFLNIHEGKNLINHINGQKNDNRLENLEWCNASENMFHAFSIGLKMPQINNEIPIIMYDKKSKDLIMEFNSISKASRYLGCGRSEVSANLKNRQKSVRGYYFNYK